VKGKKKKGRHKRIVSDRHRHPLVLYKGYNRGLRRDTLHLDFMFPRLNIYTKEAELKEVKVPA
jgi:hypothetical protein